MRPEPDPPSIARPAGPTRARTVDRRRCLAMGIGVGAVLVDGCSAGDPTSGDPAGDGSPAGGSAETAEPVGTFELLISDQPVAIDEFDSLDVSFDRARIFGDDNADASSPTPTPTPTGTPTDTATPNGTTPTGAPPTVATTATDTESADGDRRGFSILDLEGATVDLTQVVGNKAMSVFEGALAEGRYTKIELYGADVVVGEPVQVTIPSGKLQLVKPFEVVAGETLRFVFDINVVRKGQSAAYNLLPVISESGVAGTDVPVEEVSAATGSNGADGEADPGDDTGGPPADAAGNETEATSKGGDSERAFPFQRAVPA